MSIFDVARFLSYSKSIHYFDRSIRTFNLENIGSKDNFNSLIKDTKNKPIRFEKTLKED